MVSLVGALLLAIMPHQGLAMVDPPMTEVMAARAKQAPVLAFHATWCKPCKKMAVQWKRIEKAGYKVRYVDIDNEPELAKKWGITGVPTTIAARQRFVGVTSAETILKALRKQKPNLRGINFSP